MSERSFKISLYLPTLWSKVKCPVFIRLFVVTCIIAIFRSQRCYATYCYVVVLAVVLELSVKFVEDDRDAAVSRRVNHVRTAHLVQIQFRIEWRRNHAFRFRILQQPTVCNATVTNSKGIWTLTPINTAELKWTNMAVNWALLNIPEIWLISSPQTLTVPWQGRI